MKKISLDEFLRLRKLVCRSARPLDYTRWKFLFENGSCDDFLSVLSSYQNEDGGFGYNIECNNWNPNSSPYTVCIALDYLDTINSYDTVSCHDGTDSRDTAGSHTVGGPDSADNHDSGLKSEIIAGIVRYLSSGAYLLEDGWTGMQGIPSNNDFAHMPWFHFDPVKAAQADIGVTKRLADFLLRHADADSDICRRAADLKERYAHCGLVLLDGYPDYDPEALHIQAYDPATYPAWLPLPVYFVGSPESSFYPACRHTVEMNLDSIIDSLLGTKEIHLPSAEELAAFEQSNPHPDGKRWCVAEQTIGNYYWGSHFIIHGLDTLRKFGRLDFELPVLI